MTLVLRTSKHKWSAGTEVHYDKKIEMFRGPDGEEFDVDINDVVKRRDMTKPLRNKPNRKARRAEKNKSTKEGA